MWKVILKKLADLFTGDYFIRKVSSEDGSVKTKVSPQNTGTSVSELTETCDGSEQDDRVKAGKRKLPEGREEPLKTTKKSRFDLTQTTTESTSSSLKSGKAESTHGEDVLKKNRKRKTVADGEGPSRKRRRRQHVVKDSNEDKDNPVDALKTEFQAKYQQQDQLGEGGCGSVYAGLRLSDNLPVALKYIPAYNVSYNITDRNEKHIPTEVAIMLKLASGTAGPAGAPGWVSLLDWYDLGKEVILVLERPVPSTDLVLYRYNNGGRLKEKEAKIIMKQLVSAAKDLEDHGIFHRDIKLDNVLIETSSKPFPRAWLIDFGLSCFTTDESTFSSFLGAPPYVPPEVYSGSTIKPGPVTVWQLGIVLFEILHRPPFDTRQFLKSKLKIRGNLSEHCRDLLQMCLAAAPEQRPSLEKLLLHPWII